MSEACNLIVFFCFLFFPPPVPRSYIVAGHHLHRPVALLQFILRRRTQPGLLSRSLPLRRHDHRWYAARNHSHLRGPPFRIGNSTRIGMLYSLFYFIISWLTPLMIFDVGFDLLADGIRPLSDGRNPLAWILRHLPQSARQFECGAIARGIIFHLKSLILFSYLYLISSFFLILHSRCSSSIHSSFCSTQSFLWFEFSSSNSEISSQLWSTKTRKNQIFNTKSNQTKLVINLI